MSRPNILPLFIALFLTGAFTLQAQAPATPSIERYLPSLRAIMTNNEAIIQKQENLLKRIEEAKKTADSIRILSKRG